MMPVYSHLLKYIQYPQIWWQCLSDVPDIKTDLKFQTHRQKCETKSNSQLDKKSMTATLCYYAVFEMQQLCALCIRPCHKVPSEQGWKPSSPWSRHGGDRMSHSSPVERLLWVFDSSEICWWWCKVTDTSRGLQRVQSARRSAEQQSPDSSDGRKHCAMSCVCPMWTAQSTWNLFCTVH